jgi:hypothetical protein
MIRKGLGIADESYYKNKSFDTEDIGMDITDWTKEDLESYYVETFVEDIYSAIKYDDIKDMVRVEVEA